MDVTEKHIARIVHAEKQAEFYTVKDSPQWRRWKAEAYTLRRQINEWREWWKLQAIFLRRGA